MIHSCRLGFPALMLLGFVLFSGLLRADEETLLRYLHEVLLEKEHGGGKGRVLRWEESAHVVLVEGNKAQAKVLDDVMAEINDALKGTAMSMKRVQQAEGERLIEVFMVPTERFREVAEAKGIAPQDDAEGFAHVTWSTEKTGSMRADVLIDVSKVKPEMLRHVVLEEMTQTLGPLGDTSTTPESVMFSKRGDQGKAPMLGEWDRKMLRLLYGHLKADDDGIRVGVAYARHWGE